MQDNENLNRQDLKKIRLGYFAVIASAILFSAKSVFIKMCYAQGTAPVVLMALRAGYALPFFLAMAFIPMFLPKSKRPNPLGSGDLWIIFGLGLLGYYLASVFDVVGLAFISAGSERLILYLYPSMVVIFSALIFRTTIPRYMVLPIILCYAGIALSFGSEISAITGGRPYFGGFLVLMSAICYALFLVGHGRMVHTVGPQRLAAYSMLAATVAVAIQFLVLHPLSDLAQPLKVQWIAMITGIVCNVIPVYLFGYGVKQIGSGKAAVLSSVGPVSTYGLAAFLLGERPGILQVTGLALVLIGGYLLSGGNNLNWFRKFRTQISS